MEPKGVAFIYVAAIGDDWHKIGMSGNVGRRLYVINYSMGDKASIIYSRSTTSFKEIEAICHSMLADKHLEGEWFLVSREEAIQTVEKAFEIWERIGEAPKKLFRGALPRAIPVQEGDFSERMARLSRIVSVLRPGETQRGFVQGAIEAEVARREEVISQIRLRASPSS